MIDHRHEIGLRGPTLTSMLPELPVAAHFLLLLAVSVRVIMRRPAPDTALAWLFLVASLPIIGFVIYLLIGERRINPRRTRAMVSLQQDYRRLFAPDSREGGARIDWRQHHPAAESLDKLGTNLVGSPAVAGNAFQLYDTADEALRAIARDVGAARTDVVMVFYIWNAGGVADEVLDALTRAAARGVSCRILIDAHGGRPWLRGPQPERLRRAGVEVRQALPVGILRSFAERSDVRLHRKIAVIDGKVAWTGSMNLVDPHFFKLTAGVGEWVDAMVRLEGPAVPPLAATAIGDWMLETGEPIGDLAGSAGVDRTAPVGSTDIQVIPTGPGQGGDALLQMLLTLINSARKEVVVTTPYLVPDPAVTAALRGAAGRGVAVSIILPQRVDSILTRYASRSYYDNLLEAGVSIHLYRAGLLHTKSIVVDGRLSMFGTVNIDMRSLWLNYEITLFVFDRSFAEALHALQDRYMADSDRLEPGVWAERSLAARALENAVRLISPML